MLRVKVKVNRNKMILFMKGKLVIVGDFGHSDGDGIIAGAGGSLLITGGLNWIGDNAWLDRTGRLGVEY